MAHRIAVLGTYSAGKSTFLNDYLDYPLQLTGNQAVDDKFTVVCYGQDAQVRALPALALDADPRFPFYKISHDLEASAPGEGGRMDAYLQLKTCPSEVVRGRIFIDSPGFDADEQRTAVLRLTDHIVALSDLVLVFFDARHPEAGSMRDTLEHLVEKTIRRTDSSKFLYVLNHLDATAQDDNAEQVVAAWQRGLAQKGLTAGRFYHIYSRSAAAPIADPQVRARYEALREHDYGELQARIQQVRTAQAYRVVGTLERSANELERQLIPQLRAMLRDWRTGSRVAGRAAARRGAGSWAGCWSGSALASCSSGWGVGAWVWQLSWPAMDTGRFAAGCASGSSPACVETSPTGRWTIWSEPFSTAHAGIGVFFRPNRRPGTPRPGQSSIRSGPRPTAASNSSTISIPIRPGRPAVTPRRPPRRRSSPGHRLARLSPAVPICVCPDADRVQTRPDSPRTGRPNYR